MLSPQTWVALENPSGQAAGLRAVRLHPETPLNIFAAIDRSTGHRMLLLKLRNDPGIAEHMLPTGRGFITRSEPTVEDGDGRHCMRFELSIPAYAEAFDVIGNAVLTQVLKSPNEEAAALGFIGKIVEWQSFLDQLPSDGLSEQKQLGLFAELLLLRDHLLDQVPAERAIVAWSGPKAFAKDFEFPGLAFEVKATSAKQHARLSISNELQLNEAGVGRLLVFAVLVERLVAGGVTLVGLVRDIRALLVATPAASALFAERLLQAGYVDAHAGRYEDGYSIRARHFLDVKEGFPRLIETDLMPGIGDVRYSVALSACSEFELQPAEVTTLLKTLPL